MTCTICIPGVAKCARHAPSGGEEDFLNRLLAEEGELAQQRRCGCDACAETAAAEEE